MSEDDKYQRGVNSTKYTVIVGVLGVLGLMAQSVLPMLGAFLLMPGALMGLELPDTDEAVYHQTAFWYEVTSTSFSDENEHRLVRLNPGSQTTKTLTEEAFRGGQLVSAGGALWVVSGDRVQQYDDGKWETFDDVNSLGTFSCPFAYRDRPAVIEKRPQGMRFRTFRDGNWNAGSPISLGIEKSLDDSCSFRVLGVDDRLHLFYQSEGVIYHRIQSAEPGHDLVADWDPVARDCSNWAVLLHEGDPMIFHADRTEGFRGPMTGKVYRDGTWQKEVTVPEVHSMGGFVATFDPDTDSYYLLLGGFPGKAKLIQARDGEILSKASFGRSMFSSMMMPLMVGYTAMGALIPLGIALILTYMMAGYRQPRYRTSMVSLPYASIARRALARGIDLVVYTVPWLVAMVWFMSSLEELFLPGNMVYFMVLTVGGFFWFLILSLVFSFTEGRWGQTPGKWFLGIEVRGEDLEYCGFWRALVRNLMMFVDGFFYFLVALLLIALTEHWQRLGDMAARTVVVHPGSTRGSANAESQQLKLEERIG